jgi:glycine oxidase
MRRPPRMADAVVVGGGLVGCAVARALARRGLATVVLERGRVGGEASSAAAGLVAPQAECDAPGPLMTAGIASRRRYARFVAAIEAESDVDVAYRRDGILYVAPTAADAAALLARVRWQRAAGLRATRVGVALARRWVPWLPDRLTAAAHFPDDHRVDNERLAWAIGVAARRAGVRVIEGVTGIGVTASRGRVVRVATSRGAIATPLVVDAAGAWAAEIALPRGVARPRVRPVRGQIVVLRPRRGRLRMPLYAAHAYLVPRPDGRVLAGSTYEDVGFDKRVTAGAMARILGTALAMAPGLADATVEGSHAGLRPGTADGLPIVGRAPGVDGLFLATGLYRSGILLAPLVADAIADLALDGRTTLPIAAFDPAR